MMSTTDPHVEKRIGVVLLSGGLDSATVLAIAMRECDECIALTFDYGQRHHFELEAARTIAQSLGIQRHFVLSIDLRAIGASALTADEIGVPYHEEPDQTTSERIAAGPVPVTYVPARNTIFLSIAVALAESVHARDIYIGANAIDYSGYPDCRPEFIEAFERAANLGTRTGTEGQAPIRINAPLIEMTKARIIQRGAELGVNYALTHSCYDPAPADGAACGRCDACILRQRGFEAAGVSDPTRYR